VSEDYQVGTSSYPKDYQSGGHQRTTNVVWDLVDVERLGWTSTVYY